MASNYFKDDPIYGMIDLDDEYITDAWLIEKYSGNTLFSWGTNTYGQLGTNRPVTVMYSSPIQVGSLNTWRQISGSNLHMMAIDTSNKLWACGNNNLGQLGNNTIIYYSSPIQVGALTNWKQVACGYFDTTYAIKTNNSLWAWGLNSVGQLGNNTIIYYSSPIQVGALTNWKQVSAGYLFTLAVKLDGTLWSVGGNNNKGKLGLNLNINVSYSSPVQVGALTNWKQVSAGYQHFAAIKTDNTLWACGYNIYGQLGNNNSIDILSPVQIGTLADWKQVICGINSTLAIKTDNTLWACGYNGQGQLGNNTNINYSSPIQIGALTNWKQVSIFRQTIAVKTDNTLWAIGYNILGALGDGTIISKSSPVQIGTLAIWKQAACLADATFATTILDIN